MKIRTLVPVAALAVLLGCATAEQRLRPPRSAQELRIDDLNLGKTRPKPCIWRRYTKTAMAGGRNRKP